MKHVREAVEAANIALAPHGAALEKEPSNTRNHFKYNVIRIADKSVLGHITVSSSPRSPEYEKVYVRQRALRALQRMGHVSR